MSMPDRSRLIDQVMEDHDRVLHLIKEIVNPRWPLLDLTMAQLRALIAIAHSGPIPVGRLGAALGVGKPAATLLVDALARLDLVLRREDPEDRRRTLVELSPRGRALLDEFFASRRERLLAWAGKLDDGDLAALARGLHALVAVATGTSRAESA